MAQPIALPTSTVTVAKGSKLKAPKQMVKIVSTNENSEAKENLKLDSITATKKVTLKPKVKTTMTTSIPTISATKEEKTSKKTVRIQPQEAQAPSDQKATTITTTTQLSPSAVEQQQNLHTKKPSLLPKPKVKVVLPPSLLNKQHLPQQQQQQQKPQQEQQEEESEYTTEGEDIEMDIASSSRIPVRTANAEKRALMSGLTVTSSPSGDISTSPLSTSDTKKSKALIK